MGFREGVRQREDLVLVPANRDGDEVAREIQHQSALRDPRILTDDARLDALEKVIAMSTLSARAMR